MRLIAALSLALLASLAGGCDRAAKDDQSDRPETARDFPRASRPVSAHSENGASEQARDDRREATTVMDLAHIAPGMTVADIGAGEGYYTVRLAERVGTHGRVLAADFVAANGAELLGIGLAGVLISALGVPWSIFGLGVAVAITAAVLAAADRRDQVGAQPVAIGTDTGSGVLSRSISSTSLAGTAGENRNP